MKKGECTPIIDRLLSRVVVDDSGCWLWHGSVSGRYGMIKESGHGARAVLVHRVSYEHFVGPIADGLSLDHLCRTPLCVNPEHLDAVPHRTNVHRGVGPTAINAAKTHCVHGHEFNQANTRIDANGGRQCRACHRVRTNNRRAHARVSG